MVEELPKKSTAKKKRPDEQANVEQQSSTTTSQKSNIEEKFNTTKVKVLQSEQKPKKTVSVGQIKEVKHGILSHTTPDVNVNVNDQSVLSAPAKLAGNDPESTNVSSGNDQSPPLSTRDASHGQISDEFEILGDDEIQGQDQGQAQGQEQDQDQEQEQENRNTTPTFNPSVYHDASPELGPNDLFAISLLGLMTVFGLDIKEYTPVLLRLRVYSAG